MFRRRSFLPLHLEWFAHLIARLLYRVRTSGLEAFPAQGGVLLIANHLSYVDVVVLQLACPRPIRFVAHHWLRRNGFLNWCFERSGSIGISAAQPRSGMHGAVEALRRGEVVCVCPEGHISRTGQLMRLHRGFEVIAARAGAPVVAAAVDGLWGSIFSFAGNQCVWKSPRLLPTAVHVAFGRPQPAAQAGVEWARRELLDLGERAFQERPVLRRHLGREAVRALAKQPGRILVIDRTAERRVLSCAQIYAAAALLSRRLRANVPGRRVGIVLPPGAGGFIANLAVAMAGKIPVNLNFTAGRDAILTSLRIGGIETVLSAKAMQEKLPAFPWPAGTVDLRAELEAAGGRRAMLPWLLAAWLLPNQVCANLLGLPRTGDREEAGLLFTSGSSGEPKGVVLTHRNILANCLQISSLSILPERSSVLGCLPIFHSFGFTVTLWYPILRGSRVVTVPSPLDTRRIIDAIAAEQVRVMVGAPTFIRPILKKAQPAELRSLDLVVTGAERLPDDLKADFLRQYHLEIQQGYGLTETAPATNITQPDPPIIFSTNEPQEGKRAGSVGRLLPGLTARIVDPETMEERPETDTGLILLRGANVFEGYLDDPGKTRQAFCRGWFVTGDLGRFDVDGFLYIEGRLSRFSKIAGEMVPHGTVEQRIVEAFGWDQSEQPVVYVTGIPDQAKGEALVLLTTEAVTLEQLRARLAERGLPNLWVPKIIHRVERIPMLGTGKTDLKQCRELALHAVKGG